MRNDFENECWADVVTYYYSFYSNYTLKSINELETVNFLYNSKIKVDKKPIRNNILENNGNPVVDEFKDNILKKFSTLVSTLTTTE